MKNTTATFIVFVLIVLSVYSCQFSEDIYVNEDGSGKMEFVFDGSKFMQMMGSKMEEEGEVKMDSTIVFKDFLELKKDSISKLPEAEQKKLKALEPYIMTMFADPETMEMEMKMSTDFRSVSDLQDMFKAMNNMSNLNGKGGTNPMDNSNPFAAFGQNGSSNLNYEYDGKVFKRITTITDTKTYKSLTDSIGKLEAMFASSTYKLNYHFHKKIASVSNKDALFSADGKTVIVEYNFIEYLKNPKALDLDVVLED